MTTASHHPRASTGSPRLLPLRHVPEVWPDHVTDIAVLLDWENLKLGAQRDFAVSLNLCALLRRLRSLGRIVQLQAFADWSHPALSDDARQLLAVGIAPVFVASRPAGGGPAIKNSADLRLAVEALDLCHRLPSIGAFVLGTGDGDLVHALAYLRAHGKRVIVLGVGSAMSTRLAQAADTTLIYERDIEPALVTPFLPPPDQLHGDQSTAGRRRGASTAARVLPTPDRRAGSPGTSLPARP